MILTRGEYDKYVKPLYDKLYNTDLSIEEQILVGDFVKELLAAEFKLESLKKLLSGRTAMQQEFLEKHCGKELEQLLQYLNEKT